MPIPEWLATIHASLVAVPFGLYLATFGICFTSGFLPIVNAEAYMLAAAALGRPSMLLPLTAAATAGQMTAKSLLYLTGRGVLRLPAGRHEERLLRVREKLERHRGRAGALMFVSAFAGLPPFYVVSIVAGTLRVHFGVFFLAGATGRFLRFGVLVLVPQIVRALA